jgi:hypothetical protein
MKQGGHQLSQQPKKSPSGGGPGLHGGDVHHLEVLLPDDAALEVLPDEVQHRHQRDHRLPGARRGTDQHVFVAAEGQRQAPGSAQVNALP